MRRPLVLAAGGVLWRGAAENPEVAVVHRPAYDDWSLPKGKAKPGEHLLVTAVREVGEETGQAADLGPRLTTVRYRVTSGGRSADKAVTYWAMRGTGGEFAASKEVDELRWLRPDAARDRLSSPADKVVLDTFLRSPKDTRPLLLVRHGSRGQAEALVPVLQGLGVTSLVSADLAACVATLAPFASASSLEVRREADLSRSRFAGQQRAVADGLRQGSTGHGTLAVCAQQKVISGLLGQLGAGGSVRPPPETSVKKGGWWLLHVQDGAVSAFERHEPAA